MFIFYTDYSIAGNSIAEHPGSYMYAASKHAVRVLSVGLTRELRDVNSKIKVTVSSEYY